MKMKNMKEEIEMGGNKKKWEKKKRKNLKKS